MSFSEPLKLDVRRRAHFRCCMCRGLGVEVHHIIPQAEGGPDTDYNAAPLCPSCHETYGANPTKRKFVRECRDLWNDLCSQSSPSPAYFAELADVLRGLSTKEDIERLAVRNSSYMLGNSTARTDPGKYSFLHPEFIHPRVVHHLMGTVSDNTGEPIVAIDLSAANRSNRFYGEFSVAVVEGRTWISWHDDDPDPYSFRYSHLACSESGVHMIECWDCMGMGGSGRFASVGLFAFESDRILGEQGGKICTRERTILKLLGRVGLGDRYYGQVTYDNGFLVIPADQSHLASGDETERRLPIL